MNNKKSLDAFSTQTIFLRFVYRFPFLVLLIVEPFFSISPPISKVLQQAKDPVAQCANGLQLFFAGKYQEAFPELESGFSNRDKANFSNIDDLGKCALGLGILYENTGKNSKALEAFQVALVSFQKSGDRVNEGEATNRIGMIFYAQGRYLEALDQFNRSLLIAQEMGNQPAEDAAFDNLGAVYKATGRLSEAENSFGQALLIEQQINDLPGEYFTLNNMGTIYQQEGKYSEALGAYKESISVARQLGDKQSEGMALTNIASLEREQGNYDDSIGTYLQALSIAQDLGDISTESVIRKGMGNVHLELGQYDQASEQFQEALSLAREVGARDTEGDIIKDMGSVFMLQGQYALALDSYQQALVIKRQLGDKQGEAQTLNDIGVLYRFQARYAKALEVYRQALDLKIDIGDRAGEANTLNNIGVVFVEQAQPSEAIDYYLQALPIRREVKDQTGEADTLTNLGSAYSDLGNYEEALKDLQQALIIRRDTGDLSGESVTLDNIGSVYSKQTNYAEAITYHRQSLTIERKLGDRLGEGETLLSIASNEAAQKQYAEAIDTYEQAAAILEELRRGSGNDTARSSFISQYSLLYDNLIDLYLRQDQIAKAFLVSERGRARAFLDGLATGYVELNDNAAESLYNQEQETYAIRQAAQDALIKAKTQNLPDQQLISDLEAQLVQAEKDHQAALDTIAARGDQLAQIVPGRSAVLDLGQVQALLDNQTTLLSYWVGDDEILVFVLTHSTYIAAALPVTRADLHAQIQAFRSFDNTEIPYPPSAIELYRELIEPVKSYLKTPHLAIVPHGELHYLPFAALTDGSCYLIDDFAITYLPSASAWKFIQTKSDLATTNPLILGNPTSDQANLQPLRFAENEARTVAGLYQTQPLLGRYATETAVRDRTAQASILHLAAHGHYNPDNPLFSTIYLAPDGRNDGQLQVEEIYGLKLTNTNLVVLSACESQKGKLNAGDELVGLTRAFFFAGTPSVIASQWNVNDQVTQLLMEKFYSHWNAGMSKAQALQQAQIEIRQHYPNPYYWAAFELSGDGGKISEVDPTEISTQVAASNLQSSPPSVPGKLLFIPVLVCGCCAGGLVIIAMIVLSRRNR
jgi:CHAT domain-containing protein/tetratricopeptide (TPR) repeat protein